MIARWWQVMKLWNDETMKQLVTIMFCMCEEEMEMDEEAKLM